MDRLREQYARPPAEDIDIDEIAADDSAPQLDAELSAMLHEWSRLPLIENEILTLFYLQELALDEVALVLGIPIGTVKSRLFRARKMLRRELDLKGIQNEYR